VITVLEIESVVHPEYLQSGPNRVRIGVETVDQFLRCLGLLEECFEEEVVDRTVEPVG
jgi:hypothetical protein